MANAKDHDEKEPKTEKVENQSDLLKNRVRCRGRRPAAR